MTFRRSKSSTNASMAYLIEQQISNELTFMETCKIHRVKMKMMKHKVNIVNGKVAK